jgi:hypothetical protein
MTEREIETRRRAASVPMSELCYAADLPYSRVWHGLRGTKLTADELRRLAQAMESLERTSRFAAAV